jgi:dihydroorotase
VAGMVAATVTPQHLLMNRNAIFKGGLQPHNYCLPVLKRETHSECLNSLFECLSYLLFGDPVSMNSCVKS